MNVFVLCTGRSGSMTFAKACGHFSNFSSGHETRARYLGAERMTFPSNHIEVDNHLAWHLGQLEEVFGNKAYYVHLIRDAEKVSRSFARLIRSPVSNVRAYQKGVLMRNKVAPDDILPIARDYVETVNSNIRAFLTNKTQQMTIDIDNAADRFPNFADAIDAEGDMGAALAELAVRHNTKADAGYLTLSNAARKVARRLGLVG